MKTPSSIVGLQFGIFRLSHILVLSLAVLLHFGAAYRAVGATIIWSGPTGADTNWSTGSNWTNASVGTSGTAPGSGDDVKFFDVGSVGSASNINNTVDGGFAVVGAAAFESCASKAKVNAAIKTTAMRIGRDLLMRALQASIVLPLQKCSHALPALAECPARPWLHLRYNDA